jgi:hypothetical protein
MDRKSIIQKIFDSKFINFKEEAFEYVKVKNLDKINNNFSNENVDDILYGLNKYYVNDYKQKNIYELYRLMCNDFMNNNKKINYSNSSIFLSLLKNLSTLDKGYLLLNYLNSKYNLVDYSGLMLNNVLMKGTLTNLLFWKKLMTDNYIFTIENLIIVCKNSDYRMIKYFVENNNINNYNINAVNVSKILSTISISNHIPLKFKLRRLKLLNQIIDFNNYLDIMITKLPLYMINKIHKFYNFIDYKLSVSDLNYLSINNVDLLLKFYDNTNDYNKSIIELLLIFLGETNINDYKYVLANNNLQDYLVDLFCHFSSSNNPFNDFNSENFKKGNYDLMVKIMKNNFKKKMNSINYVININNYWDSKIIVEYVYFLLPFIERLDGSSNNLEIDKYYSILRRFFVRIYNKRIKYNKYMELFNKNNSEEIIINNNINITTDISSLNNKNGYIGYYFEGIMTNKLPPNILLNVNVNNAIYLEDESLYLVFDVNNNLCEHHEYLVRNKIKLNMNNYHKVLEDYIENNINSSDNNIRWFPLIFEKLLNINNTKSDINSQYIYIKDLANMKNIMIVKNKENIYVKLKLVNMNNNIKLVDYNNNNYDDIYDILKDKIDLGNLENNIIIKYYPYKKDYEICYYSIRPNKKDKIDYLLYL